MTLGELFGYWHCYEELKGLKGIDDADAVLGDIGVASMLNLRKRGI